MRRCTQMDLGAAHLRSGQWIRLVWGTFEHADGRRRARHVPVRDPMVIDPKPWRLYDAGVERERYRTITELIAKNP